MHSTERSRIFNVPWSVRHALISFNFASAAKCCVIVFLSWVSCCEYCDCGQKTMKWKEDLEGMGRQRSNF